MHKLTGLLLAVFLAAGMPALEPSHPPPGYSLVFADDFSGARLDESRWMYRMDVKMDSSQRPENVFLRDGKLVIALRKQEHRGKRYTGGGVISRRSFRYGYFEARVKMHGGAGWHQSVWAMIASPGTTYPAGIRTEIDAIEFDSDLPVKGHMGLIRWLGPTESRSSTCTPGVYRGPLGFDATADFHNYGFEWTERGVRFFVDGDLRCVLPYPPEEGEHDRTSLWLTAIAHTALAGPVDDSQLPGEMLVEHAAVYQRDLYVDDGDPEYSESGAWERVTRGGYADAGWRRSCTEQASASWRLDLPAAGTYEIFLYKNCQRLEGGMAEVEIEASGGVHRRQLDFTSGPAGWNSLGAFAFQPGRGVVRIRRLRSCVSADMVKAVAVH
ncbi:MAG: family 16 glycosylhydrolase [Bryobacteraceae bacterium]